MADNREKGLKGFFEGDNGGIMLALQLANIGRRGRPHASVVCLAKLVALLGVNQVVCDRKGLRPKDSAEISVKLRPKHFRHYCLVSVIRPKENFRPKMAISAENCLFLPNFSSSIILSSSGWSSRVP